LDFTHLSIATVQRSSGQSTVARAAYQSGHRLVDERTGQAHDYRYRRTNGDVILSALVHPDGRIWKEPSPIQLESLWNEVEQAERRRDSQVGRTGIVALPHRLSLEGQQQVVLRFSVTLAQRYKTPIQFDLHAPSRHKAADARNIHGHWQMPTRSLDEHGSFQRGEKILQLSNRNQAREEVKAIRGLWVDAVNAELEREGIVRDDGSPMRLDARSYSDRGIDRIPEMHVGVAATALERQGIRTSHGDQNRAIRADNLILARLDHQLGRLEEERKLLAAVSESGQPADSPDRGEECLREGTDRDSAPHQPGPKVPRLTGLAMNIAQFRELVEMEKAERELLNRITEVEQESQVTLDEPLRAVLNEFGIAMRSVFKNGYGAERAWREYRSQHGSVSAVAALRQTPELFGSLRVGKASRLGWWQDDRTAREAAPDAAEAGARLAQELERLEISRMRAEGRRDQLRAELRPRREWIQVMERKRSLRLRITEQWLALPVSATDMLKDTYPDIARLVEEKQQATEPGLTIGLDRTR
jgi:hypothetical protein